MALAPLRGDFIGSAPPEFVLHELSEDQLGERKNYFVRYATGLWAMSIALGTGVLIVKNFISEAPTGGLVTLAQMEQILFGGLIVMFLILEPLGLYGIWIRIRNYWKAWPFSY